MRIPFLFAVAGLALLPALARGDNGDVLPPPPYPPYAWALGDWGNLMLMVTFGSDGRVKEVRIEKSQVSAKLAQDAVDFITRRWRSTRYAGTSQTVPIVFAPAGSYLPHPPYPAEASRDGVWDDFTVHVTFNDKGRAVKCTFSPSTAPDALTTPTCAFILAKWCAPSFAGKTVDAPISFRRSSELMHSIW